MLGGRRLWTWTLLALWAVQGLGYVPGPRHARAMRQRSILRAGLKLTEGASETELSADGTVELTGCVVEGKNGRFWCTDKEGSGTSINGAVLSADVRYLLTNGQRIKTTDNKEFLVNIDNEPKGGDAMTKMIFDSFKAGFPTSETES